MRLITPYFLSLIVLSRCQRDNALPSLHRCRRHGVFLEVALPQHEIQVSVCNIFCSFFQFSLVSSLFIFSISVSSLLLSDQPVKFVERSRPGVQVATSSFSSGKCIFFSSQLLMFRYKCSQVKSYKQQFYNRHKTTSLCSK